MCQDVCPIPSIRFQKMRNVRTLLHFTYRTIEETTSCQLNLQAILTHNIENITLSDQIVGDHIKLTSKYVQRDKKEICCIKYCRHNLENLFFSRSPLILLNFFFFFLSSINAYQERLCLGYPTYTVIAHLYV